MVEDKIHFVCDKWIEPSTKDCERGDKGSLWGIFSIKGPAQIRPSDWGEAIKNKSFNEILIGFLKYFFNTLEIWLEVAAQGKNKLQLINVKSIYPELGENLCKAHPA